VKKSILLLPLIAALPLSAGTWEAGVFVGQQVLKSGTATYAGTGTVSFEPDKNKTFVGVRLGRSIVDFGPVLLTVTAGYQPEVTTTFKVDFTPVQTGAPLAPAAGLVRPAAAATIPVGASTSDYKSSHYSVGAMLNFKAFVSVGAGIEYRFEKLDSDYYGSTNYARPWARVNAGISIPSPILKPFIGIEADFPLVSKSLDQNPATEDNVKAAAPKSQIGIYAGIRF